MTRLEELKAAEADAWAEYDAAWADWDDARDAYEAELMKIQQENSDD
jgi:hypothetical protein